MGNQQNRNTPPLDVSVVIPVCNEEENILPLAREIHVALNGRYAFETLFVDDGSTDGTARAALAAREQGMPEVRLIKHAVRSGQSAAVATGVRYARAPIIATLDGDGQNDPADIPKLLDTLRAPDRGELRLVMGNRTTRRDTWLRRLSSARRIPVAVSKSSTVRFSWTCHVSITCIASCRPCFSAKDTRSSRSLSVIGSARRAPPNTVFTIGFGSASSTCLA
jgi:glycosyltransferase involved in cell wall biosynthesis